MDKIVLLTADLLWLNEWMNEHIDLMKFDLCPIKAIKIETPELQKCVLKCFRLKNGKVDVQINIMGQSHGKVTLRKYQSASEREYEIEKSKRSGKLTDDFISGCGSLYFQVMCFLVHGNRTMSREYVCEDVGEPVTDYKPVTSTVTAKTKKKPQKPAKDGVTYILRSDKNGNRHIGVRGRFVRHAKSWGVRGHYRHYKSGKVVWVEQYVKGDGKKKDKSYKVGKLPENKEDLK